MWGPKGNWSADYTVLAWSQFGAWSKGKSYPVCPASAPKPKPSRVSSWAEQILKVTETFMSHNGFWTQCCCQANNCGVLNLEQTKTVNLKGITRILIVQFPSVWTLSFEIQPIYLFIRNKLNSLLIKQRMRKLVIQFPPLTRVLPATLWHHSKSTLNGHQK